MSQLFEHVGHQQLRLLHNQLVTAVGHHHQATALPQQSAHVEHALRVALVHEINLAVVEDARDLVVDGQLRQNGRGVLFA